MRGKKAYRLRIDTHANMGNLPLWHTAFGWGPENKALVMDSFDQVLRAAHLVRVPEGTRVGFTVVTEQRLENAGDGIAGY